MDVPTWRYVMELRTEQGDMIGHAVVRPDFAPLQESARFRALRGGESDAADYDRAVRLEPVWHSKLGEPYVARVRGVAGGANGGGVESGYGYFRNVAQQVASIFVERGALKEGDTYTYFLTAYPEAAEAEEEAREGSRFSVDPVMTRVPLIAGSLPEFECAADEASREDHDPEDAPVFIRPRLLDEIREITRSSDEKETGGILIGHLRQDAAGGGLFVEVTAQVPARQAQGELTRLTFTPECWTEVRAAVALRGRGETYTGWWHSHPVKYWRCKECPPEKQATCELARGFLSEHDRALHRAAFARAWNLALVASDTPVAGVTFRLFGWRAGMIEGRGYRALRAEPHITVGSQRL